MTKICYISVKSTWNGWNATKNEKICLCDVKKIIFEQKIIYLHLYALSKKNLKYCDEINVCPYAGDIFTVKKGVTLHVLF